MRCKSCKIQFTQKRFNVKYCLENEDCIKAWNEERKEKQAKQNAKAWAKEKKVRIEKYGLSKKPPKQTLQDEINKLARSIDEKFGFGCISCGTKNNVQYAGGHRISVGACASIRYNLHDISRQCNKNCNGEKSGNPDGYDLGLIERYGLDYMNYVKYDLRKIYDYVNIGGIDFTEKIKIAREINRNLDDYLQSDAIKTRDYLNEKIGIYNENYKRKIKEL